MRSIKWPVIYGIVTFCLLLFVLTRPNTVRRDRVELVVKSGKVPPRGEEQLSWEEFIQLTLRNQGKNKKQDTLCQITSDGVEECFIIMDKIRKKQGKWITTRFIELPAVANAYLSAMVLKPPKDMTAANTDTAKWDIYRSRFLSRNYAEVMIERLFSIGLLERDFGVKARILQIGLGGGQMNTYINNVFPNIELTVVDISPLMKTLSSRWFGVNEERNLKIIITDGLQFVRDAVKAGTHYDAVLIDACNNDMNSKTICPIEPFYTPEMISLIAKVVGQRGVLMHNLLVMTEDKEWYDTVTKEFLGLHQKEFKNCLVESVSYDSSNQVLSCTQRELPQDQELRASLAAKMMNSVRRKEEKEVEDAQM